MPEQIIENLLAAEEQPECEAKLKRGSAMRRRKRVAWEEVEGAIDDGEHTTGNQPAGWEDNM